MRLVSLCAGVATGVVASLAGLAAAQPPASPAPPEVQITLAEAIAQAQARNRDLAVTRRDIDIAKGRLQQASRYPHNPELNVEGGGGQGVGRQESLTLGVGGGRIGVSQVIEVQGQRGLRVRGAEADVSRSEWSVRDREREVVAETTRVFSELLLAQERLALARQALALATSLRDTARALFEAGSVPEVDVLRADVEVRRVTTRVTLEETSIATTARALALLVGASADARLRASGPLLLEPIPDAAERLRAAARANRPDLKATEAALAAAQASLSLVQAERFLPSVTASLTYAEDLAFDARNRLVLFGLSIPLPLWNRRDGDVKAAEGEVARQEAERDRILARIDTEVDTALRQFTSAQSVVEEYLRRIVPGQEETARLTQDGYRLGEFNLTDALLAQRDLIETRTAYLASVAAYNAARVELQKAAGSAP